VLDQEELQKINLPVTMGGSTAVLLLNSQLQLNNSTIMLVIYQACFPYFWLFKINAL